MKFVVLVLVIVAVLWLARARLAAPARRDESKPPSAPMPKALEDMVRCAQCGLHLPRGESYPGRGGHYCSEAHRAEHERTLAAR